MKVAVFVDVSSLYYKLKNKYRDRTLDYKKYLSYLEDFGEIAVKRAYGSDMKGGKTAFADSLRGLGFDVQETALESTVPCVEPKCSGHC